MKTIKPQKLALLTRSFEFGESCFLSVAVILFFPLDDPRKLLSEVSLWKFAPGELGKDAALDGCMPKTRGEFLVTGSAHTLGGKPDIACAPRVRVGKLDKKLRVVGNRVWKWGAPSTPEPFTKMPITWENAFGGPDYKQNPLGKGMAKAKTAQGEVHPLPNVEDPRQLVKAPGDRPAPAGFGPYDLTWPQRFQKIGTYDQKWLKERFPGFADDLDWGIFNTAPEDQQQEGPFVGDETFTLDFLHPEKSRIEGRLPGATARCFVKVKAAEGEEFREIPTKLDTVWLFPHAERGVLVFHGTTRIAEDDASDVLQIVAACEEMGAPRTVEHYQSVLAERLDKEKGAVAALRDGDLMPDWPGASDGLETGDMQAVMDEGLLRKNQRKRMEREYENQRANMVAMGIDPSTIPALPPDDPPPSIEQALEMAKKAEADAEVQKQQAEQEKAKREEELRQEIAAQGLDPEPVLERMKREGGRPPSFSAEEELQKLQLLVAQMAQSGQDGSQFAALIADPAYRQRLVEAEKKTREAYRLTAHEAPPGPEMDGESSARLREALLEAVRAGKSFEGCDLTGADLTGIVLTGANLTGVFLGAAKLSGADLSGADLSDAVLSHADLSGANLRGARLPRANLGAARLVEAQLAEADLEEATLSKADLSRAGLQKAKLSKATLLEVKCPGADLSGAQAPELVFLKVDLSGIRAIGANLTKCTFLEAKLEGTDFTEARLESATFLEARGNGAVFRRVQGSKMTFVQQSRFEQADFREADLEGANLRGSKLNGADFTGARLGCADLSECELKGARLERVVAREVRLVRADLTEARIAGSDLMGAILQKATIQGADLQGASLYQADLSRVLSDEKVKLTGANLKKVRIDPKRVR